LTVYSLKEEVGIILLSIYYVLGFVILHTVLH
jgi:hypothetical protein